MSIRLLSCMGAMLALFAIAGKVPAVAQPDPGAPAQMTVAQLLAAPPAGATVGVAGYIVETYLCPPCPPGANCKPCFSESAVFLADTPREYGSETVPPMVGLAIADPDKFVLGQHCRFQVSVAARPSGAVVGQVVGGGVLLQ